MPFSEFLNSRRERCKNLVSELSKAYKYASILASDVTSSMIGADRSTSDISEGSMSECGFVVKLHNGRSFFEYSLDDISEDAVFEARRITEALKLHDSLSDREITVSPPSDEPLCEVEVSLRSVVYPLAEREIPETLTLTEQRIYDACVYTLKCCMHEHYEDCPWREQALYTMDSRNQMLAGYYAFGEYLFPKANLELISEDNRPDGLLSICYPMKRDFAIPSFSLHYITECEEYLRYSSDVEFIRSIYPKINKTLNTFIDRIDEQGLVKSFEGGDMWNFYEWEDGLDGALSDSFKVDSKAEYDLALNTLLSYAISRMISINERLGFNTDSLKTTKNTLNNAIHEYFYRPDFELYETRKDTAHFAKLTNALAILSGVADTEAANRIAKKLTEDDGLVDASLSMRAFLYDALISVDREKYSPYVLADIERIYAPMLKTGNNTVWETELGDADFDNAGSLCHGWSAIPIYYFNELK